MFVFLEWCFIKSFSVFRFVLPWFTDPWLFILPGNMVHSSLSRIEIDFRMALTSVTHQAILMQTAPNSNIWYSIIAAKYISKYVNMINKCLTNVSIEKMWIAKLICLFIEGKHRETSSLPRCCVQKVQRLGS